ncbi:uncharacterized protein LOC130815819 [Amaranthus tricolor]|uniref:uncharacterized protein LOC130815819 n=1 Tax=Amaranthus tricolor TaxID=29722 RepID=UPI00258AA80D|nr:uncharacterized protein LOC130815819 [Amaranthus tricolor]
MYCNLSKNQALPMALKVSPINSYPINTSKIQFFSHGNYPKPFINPSSTIFRAPLSGSSEKTLNLLKTTKNSINISRFPVVIALPESQLIGFRNFSNVHNAAERCGVVRSRKTLPWLADCKFEEEKRTERVLKAKTKASSKSSWEVSAEKFFRKSSSSSPQDENRRRVEDVTKNWQKPCFERNDNVAEDGEIEVINDPRWNKIKSRVNVRVGSDRPEMRRWNRQESWGRKTYREANESSIPKMIGEGVYGVGPVLAALTAGRREFYVLYVQEGLDLNKNNKKKKDKKGFEKVLKIAENIGLSIREISKHDLNMVVDNRPHQGLVLDSSPLEMVNIKELDPVSVEQDKGAVWVALDEVTDPQNLGAIIRSSYFFGVSGVVLCAKNSAPLSGVVSKASAGALELMEMRSCKNMMQFLTSSSENGWRVIGGSVSSRAVPLREVLPGEPTILVLGSEGTGLRPLVERSCTQLVRIVGNIPVDRSLTRGDDDLEGDMENQSCGEEFQSFMAVESLNVSVATGVLLHHLVGDNYTHNNEADFHRNGLD